ncbi:hypothetical protein CONLIGDRAFT_677880 [Coniochaeta ligniaria NRRL 30616]|uniref:Major facilitator superfamily (MFS) profile domain-containing protein n=1 Tax=Coniochaeta ligniaria NRRL 30616 TaxID=1408157 RepID=A0A1J7JVT8_9PEZI|nr:hypothetical protein CONLIGDRAFT_677880 [Coniochaeta ligniaria NRRL 30616]
MASQHSCNPRAHFVKIDKLGLGSRRESWNSLLSSVLEAFLAPLDNTYYTGVLGTTLFIDVYGDGTDQKALPVTVTSLTASSICIGFLLGALLAAPINDRWGRKAVLWCAGVCVLVGGIARIADNGIMGIIVLGRILIGLGVGQFTVTSLLYIGEVSRPWLSTGLPS